MKKFILASLVIMSQSAFCDDIVSVDYPILAHESQLPIATQEADGGHWDFSYVHAIKNGTHYDVQFKVTPTSKVMIVDYLPMLESSMAIGPFIFPQNGQDGFNNFVDNPNFLSHMFELQSSQEITLNGHKVTANIDSTNYDPNTHATTVNFSFDSDDNIKYLPKLAGFAGIVNLSGKLFLMSHVSSLDSTYCSQKECFVSLSRYPGNPEISQQLYEVE
ncbi:hypothetical protein [Photobacterium damselae]|uniref:Uncharacterized protein n=1 Tax=Photobacterium damselae TaxID=38293 RepID=A0ABD6X7R0_PHODM|nr:hypothetical protein [Photobacterium damselae]OBU43850.1 hypothetical protein AYY27_04460 [Photobacterium damselae]PSU18740.1 hypothetical protein CTM90_01805 [Photobacterium damselae]